MLDLSNLSKERAKVFVKLWRALDFVTVSKEDFYEDDFVNCVLWAFGLNPGDIKGPELFQSMYDRGYTYSSSYCTASGKKIAGGFAKMYA